MSFVSRVLHGRSRWRPLSVKRNEIRLLIVEPSINKDELISCSLLIVSLDMNPEFAALSYTWGDPNVTVPIQMNSKPWQVTTNLHEALQHLRHTSEPLAIFVDALCINQRDIDEKSTQVLLMSRVYSQANLVHCWLGPPVDDMDRVLEILTQIRREVRMVEMSSDLVDESSIKSLTLFFEKPYWKRAWIVQEVILAPQAVFHCGRYQFSREDLPEGGFLSTAISGISRRHPVESSLLADLVRSRFFGVAGFIAATTLGRDYFLNNKVGMLIFSLTRQAASVHHDHIYAILALIPPQIRSEIRPDYRATVAQVYSNFAFEFMRYDKNAAILLQAAVGMDANPFQLPSWTPDFGNDVNAAWDAAGLNFMGNSQMPPNLKILDHLILGIHAHHLDDIAITRPLSKDERFLIMMLFEPERSLPFHHEWRKFLGLGDEDCSEQEYIGGGSLEDAYWKMMCRERVDLAAERAWITSSEIAIVAQWYRRSRLHDTPPVDTDEYTREVITGFGDRLAEARRRSNAEDPNHNSYHIFKTTKGYIGMTDREHELQAGDSVYLLGGTSAPFILRPAEPLPDGERTYSIVSQAYISGLMLKTILPREVRPEMPAIDYSHILHPHIWVGAVWNNIWLR